MTPDQVKQRILTMAKTPEMWAYSVESFIMQLGLLLEFYGLSRKAARSWLIRTGSPHVNDFLEQITPTLAKKMCMSALQQLEGLNN